MPTTAGFVDTRRWLADVLHANDIHMSTRRVKRLTALLMVEFQREDDGTQGCNLTYLDPVGEEAVAHVMALLRRAYAEEETS